MEYLSLLIINQLLFIYYLSHLEYLLVLYHIQLPTLWIISISITCGDILSPMVNYLQTYGVFVYVYIVFSCIIKAACVPKLSLAFLFNYMYLNI